MMDYLIQLDYQFFTWINQDLSNTFFDAVMPFIREKKTWIPLYVVGALLMLRKQGLKHTLIIVLSTLLAVGIADGVSSHILKPLFERTRPCLLPAIMDEVNLIVSRCSGAYSFPSSHAANHLAIAIVLGLVYWKSIPYLLPTLTLWAVAIGFAQIYVGVHFPFDILGGFFVGVLAGMISYRVYKIVYLNLFKALR